MFHGMEYVYAVYQERSFSRAAEKLYISQPSLSANIKRVERKVGYPLFDRSTKPLELTECGKQYIRAVEQIHTAEHEFETFLDDFGALRAGHLVFGGSNFFSSWILPPLIAGFAAQHPDLHIALEEAKSRELVQMLLDSRIDFVLDNKELDLTVFDRQLVGREQLLLAVPKHYTVNASLRPLQIPLPSIRDGSFRTANIPAVDLKLFEEDPFLLLHPINDTGKRARMICQEYGFRPKVILDLDQQLTAFNIASSGVGITFAGELLIRRVPPTENLVYYKLRGENTIRSIYFYWKRGRYMSQAMQAFMTSVVENTRL